MTTTELVPAVLSREEALELTERIRNEADNLRDLVLRAHEGQAWKALGYEGWVAYVEAEFGMQKVAAWRILQQAKAIKALARAASVPEASAFLSGRQAEGLGAEGIAEVAERVAERVTEEESPIRRAEILRDEVSQGLAKSTRSRASEVSRGKPSETVLPEPPVLPEEEEEEELGPLQPEPLVAAKPYTPPIVDLAPKDLNQLARAVQHIVQSDPLEVAHAYLAIDEGQYLVPPAAMAKFVIEWAAAFSEEVDRNGQL